MNTKTFWIENQRFLLGCGAVLVAFFVCNSAISNLSENAEKTYVSCRELQKQVDSLHKELRRTYWAEVDRVAALELQEGMLNEDLCLPPDPDLSDAKSLRVDFNRKVGKIWSDVQAEASARGLVLPPKLTGRDFGVGQDLVPSDFAIIHSYLDVVGKALKATVLSGMTRIDSLRINQLLKVEVVLDGDVVGHCEYRGVSLKMRGPYESFGKLMQSLQKAKSFLQVRVAGRMVPVKGDGDLLQAELDFFGLVMTRESDEGEDLFSGGDDDRGGEGDDRNR